MGCTARIGTRVKEGASAFWGGFPFSAQSVDSIQQTHCQFKLQPALTGQAAEYDIPAVIALI